MLAFNLELFQEHRPHLAPEAGEPDVQRRGLVLPRFLHEAEHGLRSDQLGLGLLHDADEVVGAALQLDFALLDVVPQLAGFFCVELTFPAPAQ